MVEGFKKEEGLNYKEVKADWIKRGEAPEWVTTNLVQFFSQKYAFQNETWKGRVTKVCEYLADNAPKEYPDWWETDPYTKGKDWFEVFYNLRHDGFIVDSTPLFANAKVPERGMTISCSGATLFNSLSEKSFCRGELEQLVKNSHGCAWNFKDWLSEGDIYDKDGNRSEGIVPIIEDVSSLVRETNQGVRRGQVVFGVDIEHGDFFKVADYLFENHDHLNVAWHVKDSLTRNILKNDPEAISRFQRALQLRMQTGKGYLTKLDTMNRNKADVFKILGLEVTGSNLCVAGKTGILTYNGYKTIGALCDQNVTVWNGKEWSDVTVKKTGSNQEMIKVKFTNGKEIECTPYHKFFIKSKLTDKSVKVEAQDLVIFDTCEDWNRPKELYSVDHNYSEDIVESIEWLEELADTYCVNEPKRGKVVFNGVLTGNCNELNLPSNKDYTFSCPIINANLTMYRDFPEHLFHLQMIMQDCNVSGYLKQIDSLSGRSREFMSKIYNFTRDFRAVGCGTAGLHSLFMQEMIPVGSFDSLALNDEIFSRMRKDTYEASEWLGKACGIPPKMKEAGLTRRNATTMFSPPTKSSAELSRNTPTEGIGLQTAMVKMKEVTGTDIFRIEPVFLALLKKKGQYNKEVIKSIVDNGGSVQHLKFLSDEEKRVFLTAFEIPMEAHLDLCSARQPYFDQQQSINLYFSGSDTAEYITKIHTKALLDENINGLYYCYSMRGGSFNRLDSSQCEMCM